MTTPTLEERIAEVSSRFQSQYGSAPEFIVRAPGRVNLIGEHTDYNDGFVFPAAIDRDILIAVRRRNDLQIRAFAHNFNQTTSFSIKQVKPANDGRERWSNYLRAMVHTLQQEGFSLCGMDSATLGNVPLGSGLSSSAALLVASGLALLTASDQTVEPKRLALMAQRGEREFVGVNVGIMDQFISALGQIDHALLIDTRNLEYEAVPLPQSGVSIVIADTGKRRGLVDSEYNNRRGECERAVAILKTYLRSIRALRDVSLEDFQKYQKELPDVVCRRARHVVTENLRTLESVAALKANDLPKFGNLMNESHESLKHNYEVSCPELDAMVEIARSVEGVYGSRMTGAGFGGCTVSLVKTDAVENFQREVLERFKQVYSGNSAIYVTKASQGAERIL